MNFRPFNDRVLIRPDKIADRIGRLWVPETAQKTKGVHRTGIAVAMGPGMQIDRGGRWPMPDGKSVLPDIRGKRIHYYVQEGTATDLVIDDVLHHVVRDESIDAHINDEGEIVPLHDRILVRRHEAAKTYGVLHIPVTAQDAPLTGEIIACGTCKILGEGKSRPLMVEKGQSVMFGKYAGIEMPDKTIMMREADIIAIVELEDGAIAEALLESEPATEMTHEQ